MIYVIEKQEQLKLIARNTSKLFLQRYIVWQTGTFYSLLSKILVCLLCFFRERKSKIIQLDNRTKQLTYPHRSIQSSQITRGDRVIYYYCLNGQHHTWFCLILHSSITRVLTINPQADNLLLTINTLSLQATEHHCQ